MSTHYLAPQLYSDYFTEGYFDIDASELEARKSSVFQTHTSFFAQKMHEISEAILLPARWNVRLLAQVIQPLPGKDKNYILWGIAVQISSIALWVLTLPFAIVSFVLGFPLRCIDHSYRPLMNYMDTSSQMGAQPKTMQDLQMTQSNPLKVRTHNLGFVSSTISIIGDLRDPMERAQELATSIVEDPLQPDIIFFQETYHEDALKLICNGISKEYPYILHSIAPHRSGFSSGTLVASKYPIQNVEFTTLDHMVGMERALSHGIVRIQVESSRGPIFLYGIHAQSLLGNECAQARRLQFEQIKNKMEEDAEQHPNTLQILVGDFNTSRVTVWGDDNTVPQNQAEEPTYKYLQSNFLDLYLNDHDELTGHRKSGNAHYLDSDNARMQERLVEPSGSWLWGPFANPGVMISTEMDIDRALHKQAPPQKVQEIEIPQETVWGTAAWRAHQPALTARFDYILIPNWLKNKMQGLAEIRRMIVPPSSQSAPSDHLAVDARIWV